MASPYEQLQRVIDAIHVVEHAPELVAERAAPKIADILEAQFELGLDPYGVPWAPLARSTLKKHGPPPLTDSHEMRDHTDAVSAGNQIIATSPDPSQFHQHGTARIPARPILPTEQGGLPYAWEIAILQAEAELEEEIQALVDAAE